MKRALKAGTVCRGVSATVVATAAIAFAAPGTGLAVGEFEPNDNIFQSAGPMAGNVSYPAFLETNNDVDYYRFYVKTRAQIDLSVVGNRPQVDFDGIVYIRDEGGESYTSGVSTVYNEVRHAYVTLAPGKYFVVGDVDFLGAGSPNHSYSFMLSPLPANAITPNDICGQAVVDKVKAQKDLNKFQRQLGKVKKRKKRRQLKALKRAALQVIAAKDAILIGNSC